MENYSQSILTFLKVLFWIMIIGLAISTISLIFVAVGIVFDFESSFFQNMKISFGDFEGKIKDLNQFEKWKSIVVLGIVIAFAMIEIRLLELVVKVLNKINLKNPFSDEISNLISKIVSISVFLGIASFLIYTIINLILFSKLQFSFDLGGSDFNFLVFAGVIYIIGIIYKRGVELQNENDLTI